MLGAQTHSPRAMPMADASTQLPSTAGARAGGGSGAAAEVEEEAEEEAEKARRRRASGCYSLQETL